MDPMAEIKASFFVECGELMEALEEGLIQLQDGDEDPETVNAVFRAVHSIKGGAGAFGLNDLVHFAHRFETVLDEARSDRLDLTSDAILLFLKAADVLSDHIASARDETAINQAKSDSTIGELEALLPEGAADAEAEEEIDFAPMTLSLDLPAAGDLGSLPDLPDLPDLPELPPLGDPAPGAPGASQIRLTTQPGLAESGNEPLFLLRALAALSPVTAQLDSQRLPDLADLDPAKTYLDWDLTLATPLAEADVLEVFDFAQDLLEISFAPAAAHSAPATPERPALPDLPPLPSPPPAAAKPTPAPKPAPSTAPQEDSSAKKPKAPASAPTVRVDLDRIDRLVNLVGELVINQAMLSQSLGALGMSTNATVASGLEEFQQLTRDIQDSVMAIRAQPVKPLFQRMSRIVREAAEATGKKVRLQVEGEGTEIDKTVIERLADPLTHMIRNAVDHGLEAPEKRRDAGKSEDGTIVLSASHRSGRVVIEIEDDGAGINRPKVLEIAKSKGIVAEDAQLSDSEIDGLLFAPGFSTATTVSNLSGRGVGMDVVKRAIQALGGRITIQSSPGEGSIFSISLPLTLAVLDGMIIEVCNQTLVVPLASITETVTYSEADVRHLDTGTRVVHNRGAFIPLLELGVEFGFRDSQPDPEDSVILYIASEDGESFALLVDAILEQRQVVIKGLADTYGYVPGVAAATILGDGKIALILDTLDIIERVKAATIGRLSLAG